MTIRKYLGCDGPDCISSVEVPLASPLRDLLPEHWRAIMLTGAQDEGTQDVHFCSLACLSRWVTSQRPDDEGTGAGVPVQPTPPDDEKGASAKPDKPSKPVNQDALDRLLKALFPEQPAKPVTWQWPRAIWDASPYLTTPQRGGAWYGVARDTAGAVLR